MAPVTIQIAEFAKFSTLALLAAVLTKKGALLEDLRHVFVPLFAIIGIVGVLLLAQPDFGNLLLIVAPAFVMLAASTVPLRFVFGLGATGIMAMTVLAMSAPYRKARLLGFLDPFANAQGSGLQAVQSMVALGTGGFFGEETGFAGAAMVIALFALLAGVGVSIAFRAPDGFGRLLAVGIVAWLSIQALVNIGGVVAVLPITGVPLPFISNGGNAMLVNLFAVGVLLNISRASDLSVEA